MKNTQHQLLISPLTKKRNHQTGLAISQNQPPRLNVNVVPKGGNVSINLISPQIQAAQRQQQSSETKLHYQGQSNKSQAQIKEFTVRDVPQRSNKPTSKISPTKAPTFNALSVIERWQKQRWAQHKLDYESYLALKSFSFRRYEKNIYILQQNALKIQHWYFKLKANYQRQSYLSNGGEAYSSLHNKIKDMNILTIQEKERDAIMKMVYKRLSPLGKHEIIHSSSPPISVTKVNAVKSPSDRVQNKRPSVSRNRNNKKTYSQDEVIQTYQKYRDRSPSNDNKSLEVLNKAFDVSQNQKANSQKERGSLSSQRNSQKNDQFAKINRQGEVYEQRSFYVNNTDVAKKTQQIMQQQHLQVPQAGHPPESNQSSLLELSIVSDQNIHKHLSSQINYRPHTSRINDSQLTTSDTANLYRRFKPSKQIQEALNIRQGENRAQQIFDNYVRERGYVSKMSRGSLDNSFSASISPQKQIISPRPNSSHAVSQFQLQDDPKQILNRLRQNKLSAIQQSSQPQQSKIHHARQLTWTDIDQMNEEIQRSSSKHQRQQTAVSQRMAPADQKRQSPVRSQTSQKQNPQKSRSTSQNSLKNSIGSATIQQPILLPINRLGSAERVQNNRYAEPPRPSIDTVVNIQHINKEHQIYEDKKDEVIIDIRSTIEPNVKILNRSRSASKSPLSSKPPLHRSESATKRGNNNLTQQKISAYIKTDLNQDQVNDSDLKKDAMRHPKFSSRDNSPVHFKNFQPIRKYSPALVESPRIQPKILNLNESEEKRKIVQFDNNQPTSKPSKERQLKQPSSIMSTRVSQTSIGKTMKNYLNRKLMQKQQSVSIIQKHNQSSQDLSNTATYHLNNNLTSMSFSGAPAGTAASIDNFHNSLMMFRDNSQATKQSGIVRNSIGGSPQSNIPSSGKKKKHQLQTLKKILGSRNGEPKEAHEKLRQKSVQIIRGEPYPQTPFFPIPQQKPELKILSSIKNSPSQSQQRKTPMKTPKMHATPSQRSSIFKILQKNKSYERLRPIHSDQHAVAPKSILNSTTNKKHQLNPTHISIKSLVNAASTVPGKQLTFEEHKVMQYHKQKKIDNAHKLSRQFKSSRYSVDATHSALLIDKHCDQIIKQCQDEEANSSRNFGKKHERPLSQHVLTSNSGQKHMRHNFRPSIRPATQFDEIQQLQTPTPQLNVPVQEPSIKFTTLRQSMSPKNSSKPHHQIITDSLAKKWQEKNLSNSNDPLNIVEVERSLDREVQLQEALRRSKIINDI